MCVEGLPSFPDVIPNAVIGCWCKWGVPVTDSESGNTGVFYNL